MKSMEHAVGGKMKHALAALILIGSFVVMQRTADGHHGWAAFDSKTEVTLKGTVTDFHFVNPHSVVEFEVKDGRGEVRKWQGELTSASRLAPSGWTANSLQPGDELTVTGYCARNGAPSMWVTRIVSNGQELKMKSGN